MPPQTWEELVEILHLAPHPEGGYFRETWRSWIVLPSMALPDWKSRRAGSSILYLLPAGVRTRWHRVASDELWLHQSGDPMLLRTSRIPGGLGLEGRLGVPPCLQVVVPAQRWQSAEPLEGPYGYSLVACIVVPGFEYEDLEMADPASVVGDGS